MSEALRSVEKGPQQEITILDAANLLNEHAGALSVEERIGRLEGKLSRMKKLQDTRPSEGRALLISKLRSELDALRRIEVVYMAAANERLEAFQIEPVDGMSTQEVAGSLMRVMREMPAMAGGAIEDINEVKLVEKRVLTADGDLVIFEMNLARRNVGGENVNVWEMRSTILRAVEMTPEGIPIDPASDICIFQPMQGDHILHVVTGACANRSSQEIGDGTLSTLRRKVLAFKPEMQYMLDALMNHEPVEVSTLMEGLYSSGVEVTAMDGKVNGPADAGLKYFERIPLVSAVELPQELEAAA